MAEDQLPTRPSSSKMVAEEIQMFDGTWRVRIKAQAGKFDDEAKARFLEHYAENGRKGDAARAAGVTTKTVWDHAGKDENFAAAVMAAEENYESKVMAHVQELVFEGTKKQTFDRNGNLVSEEQIFPIPLVQMEARRVHEGYRDKREMDVKVAGGVLVAPPEVASVNDWEKKFGGKTIEGEAEEISPPEKS